MKLLKTFFVTLLIVSCSNEPEIRKPLSILVIGNSLTKAEQGGEWLGNWGMAASHPELDFCGRLKNHFENSELDKLNIAVWENNLDYDLNLLTPITTKSYDYIIFKLGENVSDNNRSRYKEDFRNIISHYKQSKSKIIIVSTVWNEYEFDLYGNPFLTESIKDRVMSEVAEEEDCIFVDISEMKNVSDYYAWNEYVNQAIASHPNDNGMLFIANKIIDKME
ncbi:SGNH/GDSL hydrolase family protein [Flavobacterium sp.]|uniref:SGNH/GDSL hydrolase family protein n=1 Tax=Flavobacterium sp. TaxID=239 RepID=UPI0040476856